jgi:hypothetical protein
VFCNHEQHAGTPSQANPKAGDNSDTQFNSFISDRSTGLVLYHDHFVDEPGAIALFYVESEAELERLEKHGALEKWCVKIHPRPSVKSPSSSYTKLTSP